MSIFVSKFISFFFLLVKSILHNIIISCESFDHIATTEKYTQINKTISTLINNVSTSTKYSIVAHKTTHYFTIFKRKVYFNEIC